MGYLVGDSKILTVLCNVLPDEDVVVFEEDVQQLVYTVQALLPHVRLKRNKVRVIPLETAGSESWFFRMKIYL